MTPRKKQNSHYQETDRGAGGGGSCGLGAGMLGLSFFTVSCSLVSSPQQPSVGGNEESWSTFGCLN